MLTRRSSVQTRAYITTGRSAVAGPRRVGPAGEVSLEGCAREGDGLPISAVNYAGRTRARRLAVADFHGQMALIAR